MRLLMLFFLLLCAQASACATFFPPDVFGFLASEKAIIIWDEENKTEHFIRRASFKTEADQAGFIVPTPTRPEFGEVGGQLFDGLEALTSPKVNYKPRRRYRLTSVVNLFLLGGGAGAAPPPALELLEQVQVAGYEVSVLKARETQALESWLQEHGYRFSKEDRAWVAPYIEKGFVLSAFRYLAEGGEGFSSQSIRMSFKTETPYYPYREPARSQTTERRSLQLYLIGEKRMEGRLGAEPWKAETPHSGPVEGLPEELQSYTEARWVTVFNDDSAVRPLGHDLTFVESVDSSPLYPPELVIEVPTHTPIYVEPLLLLLGALSYGLYRFFTS